MSYCRTTDKDSDVYIFAGSRGIEVILNSIQALERNIDQAYTFEWGDDNGRAQSLCAQLLIGTLRPLGLRVPDRAIKRLLRELVESITPIVTINVTTIPV